MFNDRWKFSRADSGDSRAVLTSQPAVKSGGRSGNSGGAVYTRHSNGLEQFFGRIQGLEGLRLLDCSGASQANIAFITNMGCKLYSEDLVQALEFAFGRDDTYQNQTELTRIDQFLSENLSFPDEHFDGALIWDVFEFLSPPMLKAVVDRLQRTLRPGSYVMAIFHAEDRGGEIPVYSYRISDAKTLLLTPRGTRRPAQFFNNRAIERVFEGFESVKFFLSRDSLREVVVKR